MKNADSAAKKFVLFFPVFIFCIAFATSCGNEKDDKSNPPVKATPALTGKFFTLSDIHFNPFYDPTLVSILIKTDVSGWENVFQASKVTGFGVYGEDSDFPLMMNSFSAMRSQDSVPDFIVITGDFLGHNFQADFSKYSGIPDTATAFTPAVQSFITKTIQFIAIELGKQFPQTPVYPVLGNNDDFCGDYMIQPNDPFLPVFANAWAPFLDSTGGQNTFMQTVPTTGYYTASLPGFPDHVIIGMNTMFFSKKNKSTCIPTDTNSGHQEMAWLKQTLAACAQQNKKVWFTCHIPPGADVHSAVKAMKKGGNCQDSVKMMWKPEYNDSFIALVNQYSNIIVGGIGGHTHMDEFRLIDNPSGSAVSFFHINPSISPIDGNNPGFELFTYNPATMVMLDYTKYVFQGLEDSTNLTWPLEYDFHATYNADSLTGQTLGVVCQNLSTDTTMRNNYINFFSDGGALARPKVWEPYWCCIANAGGPQFANCACQASVKAKK